MVKRYGMTLLLVLSLTINLLVLGAAIGRWQAGHRDRPPLIWALEDIGEQERASIRPLLRESLEDTAELRVALRRLSDQIRQQVAAEPFDEAALAETLATLRAISAQYQQRVHATALRVLPELEPQQRLKFAGRLLRPGGEPPPPHRRPSDGERPLRPPLPGE